MKLEIKNTKPEEISLDTLIEIQKKSFDKVYIKDVGDLLKTYFKESSFKIAIYDNSIIAYYQYFTPKDRAFKEYIPVVNYFLKWRDYILCHSNPDLTTLIEYCKDSSELPVDEHSIDIQVFSPEIIILDEAKDVFSAELAVLPEYRKRGVASKLIKELRKETTGKLFAFNRKDSAMHELNKKLGSKFLIQVGPIHTDGSSEILCVKK